MIKLAQPHISEASIKKVSEVLNSGNLVQGKLVAEFEQKFKKYIGAEYNVATSSGTAALHLSLLAIDIKAGDEVIIPAFTFPATANVVEIIGAKSVFADISLDDFCIDPSKIEVLITKNTKAIIVVHEFGQSANFTEIIRISKKYNLKIIEDAACAMGTEFNKKYIGTFGHLACFSFHPRKAITTGEGGLITTNSESLANKVKCLRNHGIIVENGKVDFHHAGLNYRMTDFQAALGIPQFDDFDSLISIRRRIAFKYDNGFINNKNIITPRRFTSRKHTYQTYHILINNKINRDELIAELKNIGIETNLGAQALNCLFYYRNKYYLSEQDFPNATIAYKQGLALPIGIHLKEKDTEYIIQNITEFMSLK